MCNLLSLCIGRKPMRKSVMLCFLQLSSRYLYHDTTLYSKGSSKCSFRKLRSRQSLADIGVIRTMQAICSALILYAHLWIVMTWIILTHWYCVSITWNLVSLQIILSDWVSALQWLRKSCDWAGFWRRRAWASSIGAIQGPTSASHKPTEASTVARSASKAAGHSLWREARRIARWLADRRNCVGSCQGTIIGASAAPVGRRR